MLAGVGAVIGFGPDDFARLALGDRLGREIDSEEFERIVEHLARYDGHLADGLDEPPPSPDQVDVTLIEMFAATDEPGAAALLGTDDAAFIPEGADGMIYGDGGAGKTTLAVDLAFHLAAGRAWLGIPVPKPAPVLLIENEGPRPMFRRKLRRKLAAWDGDPVEDRIRVFEAPWGKFSLNYEAWREEIALRVMAFEIDVIIAGPLTRIGMNEAGTLQHVNAFMQLVADLRTRCNRPVAVILVHHESKSGAVSGAWEGSGDTLLHVEAAGNGHTIMFVQKARWDHERQGVTMKLAWAAGEAFVLEGDRDLLADVQTFLTEHPWRTVKQISAPRDAVPPGVGANEHAIRELLDGNPDRFDSVTGDGAKALGRHPSAVLWRCDSGPDSPDSQQEFSVRDGVGESVSPPLRDSPIPDSHLTGGLGGESTPDSPPQFDGRDAAGEGPA